MVDPRALLHQTRRHFFGQCGDRAGLDGARLAARRGPRVRGGRDLGRRPAGAPRRALPGQGEERHLPVHGRRAEPARAVRLQAEARRSYHGQPIPESFIKGKRFAFMDTFAKEPPKLLGTPRKFAQHGRAGAWVSECLPAPRRRSSTTSPSSDRWRPTSFNHAPAKLFMNTGSTQFGRPSMGVVGHLRHRQRVDRPARLRRAAVRPARAARRGGQLWAAASCRRRTRACRSAPAASRSST